MYLKVESLQNNHLFNFMSAFRSKLATVSRFCNKIVLIFRKELTGTSPRMTRFTFPVYHFGQINILITNPKDFS